MSNNSLHVNIHQKKRKPVEKKFDKRVLIKAKTALERIFGSKKYVKDHYFSDGSKVTKDNVRDVLTEPSPFKYPEDLDEFAYKVMSKAWEDTEQRREFTLKYNERNNYITRQQRDMLNRLFVHTTDVKSAQTILDLDNEFYSIVEGRPIAERFNLNDYIANIREVLKTKIVTGYRMDDALLIEENLIEEQSMINEITKQYQQYAATFEEYLSQDHSTSMNLLRQSENEANKAFDKYETYREMAKEFGSLKSQVSNLEEKWRNCKMYQKFLYSVSPMHWRKQHDYYHLVVKQDDVESVELAEAESSAEVGGNLEVGEYKSLEELLEYFMEDCQNAHEPLLYFQAPWELLKVFRFIELQNLNSLLHSEELAIPLESVRENIAVAEANFDKQIKNLKESIDNLEGEILWEEERASTLEQLARELINGEFRKVICDDSTLNLHVIVEDVYEARIAQNDANLSAYDMMKAIELKYRELLLKLDYMPFDKVQKAESECYAEQTKIMRVAEEASKKIIQIERLVKRLRKILEPPVEMHIKDLKFRSMLHRHKEVEQFVEQPISEEEAEYLYLFTDFCEKTDNIKEYRQIRKRELEMEAQVLKEHEEEFEEMQI